MRAGSPESAIWIDEGIYLKSHMDLDMDIDLYDIDIIIYKVSLINLRNISSLSRTGLSGCRTRAPRIASLNLQRCSVGLGFLCQPGPPSSPK